MIFCEVEDCHYYDDGECAKGDITISDKDMTAAGFIPVCKDYEESVVSRDDGV